jgi:hypothetical protein
MFESSPPLRSACSWSVDPDETWTFPAHVIQRRLKQLDAGKMPDQPVMLQKRDDTLHYRPPRKRDEAPHSIQEYHGSGVGSLYCGCQACVQVRMKTDLRGWVIL